MGMDDDESEFDQEPDMTDEKRDKGDLPHYNKASSYKIAELGDPKRHDGHRGFNSPAFCRAVVVGFLKHATGDELLHAIQFGGPISYLRVMFTRPELWRLI